MYQIDTATAAAARPASTAPGPNPGGWFTGGNPAGGVPATILEAEFMNELMAEVINAVKAGGLNPTKGVQNQLAQAMQTLASSGTAGATAAANARVSLGVNVAGGANAVLTAAQAAYGILVLTGALTANITVAFPAGSRWTVINNTTGAFTVTCINAAGGGTGYIVRQGFGYSLYSDATNMNPLGVQNFYGTAAAPVLQTGEVYYQYSA